MTEPVGRVTQVSDPDMWQQLHDQWERERRPGWVVQRAGAISYKVTQLASGDLAFDPVENRSYYESTAHVNG